MYADNVALPAFTRSMPVLLLLGAHAGTDTIFTQTLLLRYYAGSAKEQRLVVTDIQYKHKRNFKTCLRDLVFMGIMSSTYERSPWGFYPVTS